MQKAIHMVESVGEKQLALYQMLYRQTANEQLKAELDILFDKIDQGRVLVASYGGVN